MMKRIKSVGLICLLAMLLSLSACGEAVPDPEWTPTQEVTGGDNPPWVAEKRDHDYELTQVDLTLTPYSSNSITQSGDRIYLTSGHYTDDIWHIYSFDMEGGDLQTIEVPSGGEGSYIAELAADGEGGLWLLTSDGVAVTDEDTDEVLFWRHSVILTHMDGSGDILDTVVLNDEFEYVAFHDMTVDEAGNMYLLYSTPGEWERMELAAFSPEGESLYQTEYTSKKDPVFAGWFVFIGDELFIDLLDYHILPVNKVSGEIGELQKLNSFRIHEARNGILYYSDRDRLFSQAPDEEKSYEEYDWGAREIKYHQIDDLLVLEDGRIICIDSDDEAGWARLNILTPTDPVRK